MVQNKGLIFKQVPQGVPVPGKDLVVEVREFDLEQAPPAGGITTKNFYASFDPYQRGRMRAAEAKSYSPAFPLGQPINNNTVAKVINTLLFPKQLADGANKIENPYNLDVKHFLGALGMPGLTAYSSFYEIGKPVKGETIFISSASGAVIGSVGSDDKLKYIIDDLKFDGGFNYKTEKPADALKRLAPNGVDIYYENVGGEQLEAAINAMNDHGRIIACGMISEYSKAESERYPITNLMNIVAKRITMRGFIRGLLVCLEERTLERQCLKLRISSK
ncbi:hypothetical protein DID88_000509 [Monilinia fructigena]|uniref:Enoyl reductase (ER) domain-containing protein n=1 Tax=Monilinia fructigena TaxID=38457 RepID=A0A395IHS6_9HELO|nr:hypothetical protein DID88_000509 [Monilinia fructigena]